MGVAAPAADHQLRAAAGGRPFSGAMRSSTLFTQPHPAQEPGRGAAQR